MGYVQLFPHRQSSGDHPVVPISEKITLCESITRTVASYLPKWAGKMSYKEGQVSVDARLFWSGLPIIFGVLVMFLGWMAVQVVSQGSRLEAMHQSITSIEKHYDSRDSDRLRELREVRERLDRLERAR